MFLYSVWDLKAERMLGSVLMLHPTDGSAIRAFADMINNPKSLGSHAGDYDLVRLGSFDAETGVIVSENMFTVITGIVISDASAPAETEMVRPMGVARG